MIFHEIENIKKNNGPCDSDGSTGSSSRDESKNTDPIDPTEQFSNFTAVDTEDIGENRQMNFQLNIINMIQALDKKLQCMDNHLGEMNSNFDTFSKDISSRIKSIENILSNKSIVNEKQRVSFCSDTKFNSESENVASCPETRKEDMAAERRKNKSIHKVKSYSSASFGEYRLQKVHKSGSEQTTISNGIKSSSYHKFALFSDDELSDIVDAFDVEIFEAGSLIVNQGDIYERFYVVKSGIVDAFVDGDYVSSLTSKEAFDSSLMIDSVSESTFRARNNCEIWFLPVADFRSISIYYKQMKLSFKTSFLKMVSFKSMIINIF